jgi:2-polyprenyl-3-methyl-5-hydroxy-6-metoxy-1,4-benzoquinol methylase
MYNVPMDTRWPEAYATGAFAITTSNPSTSLRQFADQIPPGTPIADVGCGPGRNSLHAAKLGRRVYASDLVALPWVDDLEAGGLISFEQSPATEVTLAEGTFGAVLLCRLIQYLPPSDAVALIRRAAASLVPGGLLMLSYVVTGGGLDLETFNVPKYSHPVTGIESCITVSGLHIVSRTEADMAPRDVNLVYDSVHTYDVVARRPR